MWSLQSITLGRTPLLRDEIHRKYKYFLSKHDLSFIILKASRLGVVKVGLLPFLCCIESALFRWMLLLSCKKNKKTKTWESIGLRSIMGLLDNQMFPLTATQNWSQEQRCSPEGGAVFICHPKCCQWGEEEAEEEEGLWVEMSLTQQACYPSDS